MTVTAVVDGDHLIGILTRSDLLRGLQEHGVSAPVGKVARPGEVYADASEPLEDAIQRMRELGRSALPVINRDKLVGLITLENVGELLVVQDALRRYAGSKAM